MSLDRRGEGGPLAHQLVRGPEKGPCCEDRPLHCRGACACVYAPCPSVVGWHGRASQVRVRVSLGLGLRGCGWCPAGPGTRLDWGGHPAVPGAGVQGLGQRPARLTAREVAACPQTGRAVPQGPCHAGRWGQQRPESCQLWVTGRESPGRSCPNSYMFVWDS